MVSLNSNKRIEILEGLRAFAAISVCLFHFVCTTLNYIDSPIVRSIFAVGEYGVQLFFVISGFVIPWSMYKAGYRISNFFKFFLKRLARLEPPYIVSVLLIILIYFIRFSQYESQGEEFEMSFLRVSLHFFYLIPFAEGYQWLNEVYWTLAIEFQFYLLIGIIFVLITEGGRVVRYLFYLLSLVLPLYSNFNFLPYWLPIFLMGIVTFLYMSGKIDKIEYAVILILCAIAASYFYSVTAVIYALIPVICLNFWSEYRIPILSQLGHASYSIYLIHPVVGTTVINVLSHHFVQPFQKAGVIFLGLILSLAAAWVFHRFVEEPSRKLSAAITY